MAVVEAAYLRAPCPMDFRLAFEPIRSLGVALRLLRRAPLTLLVGGLLLFLTEPESSSKFSGDMSDMSWEEAAGLAALSAVGCGVGLILFLVNSLLLVGYAGAVQRVMVTGEERFKDLFLDRGLWLSMVLARAMKYALFALLALPLAVLVGLPVLVSSQMGMEGVGWILGVIFAVAYVPIWGYVMLGFLLVEEAVAIEGLRPVEAVQRSWKVSEGNRIQLLGFLILTMVLKYVGVLLCCVTFCLGWVLMPLADTWARTAWFEGYLRFALTSPEDGMWVDHEQRAGS